MIGRTIGNYKVLEKIGEGGMGAVYRGVDLMLEREVAIKVLRRELVSEPDLVTRFRKEAVTLAKLNHSNIATLYSFFREGDDFFMVMEFVYGETLERVLKRRGAMQYERAVPLFCQALDGIEHAHKLGVVHRDIKPANMMLTPEGSIKVMDFGIARVLGTARLTRTGFLIGTIEYMSPEQVRGRETDGRSDVYALGVLLYEMLTGGVPFVSDSDYELMQAHVEKAPRPPRELMSGLPEAVEEAILRALEKDPAKRFQTALAFQAALQSALGMSTRASVEAQPEGGAPITRFSPYVVGPSPAPIDVKETRLAMEDKSVSEATARERLRGARGGPLTWKHYAAAASVPVLLLVLLFVFSNGGTGPVIDQETSLIDSTSYVNSGRVEEPGIATADDLLSEQVRPAQPKLIPADEFDQGNLETPPPEVKTPSPVQPSSRRAEPPRPSTPEPPPPTEDQQIEQPELATPARTVPLSTRNTVRVRLAETLASTPSLNVGRIVQLVVDRNVVVEGQVVIRRGAPVEGVISEVQRGQPFRYGVLAFKIQSVRAVDGQTIRLQQTIREESKRPGINVIINTGQIYRVHVARAATITVQ